MNPATIAMLSIAGIFGIAKIIGYIANKPTNVVVIPKGETAERKKDAKFVDDVILLDMVDEDTDYTNFDLVE